MQCFPSNLANMFLPKNFSILTWLLIVCLCVEIVENVWKCLKIFAYCVENIEEREKKIK